MPSKQQDVDQPNISPVLFMTVDGVPMSFYLRPGPAKRKLQPLVAAGAGLMCNVQQPGAILLMDPEERASIPEAGAHRYVSTQYILDCVEKDEQLNLEDYRLNVQVVPRQSARQKGISPGRLGGRLTYTAEEDAAILSYVSKHKTEIGGNTLWKAMEKQHVTNHSWQSMKTRHRLLLTRKQAEEVATTEEEAKGAEEEAKGAEEEAKEEGLQEPDGQRRSSAEDSASPQTHSAQTDLTQIDDQLIPSESPQPEIVEAQTSILPQDEVHVDPQTDKQPAESTQVETVEAETSVSPQPGRPCLDPQTDPHTVPAEATEPELEEPQTIVESELEGVSAPPAEPESQQRPNEKRKVSPEPERPQRRVTRRQIMFEMLPLAEPYGRKLRSSTTSPGKQPSSHPQATKKAKSNKSSLDIAATVDEPPSKRARARSGEAEAESRQVEAGQAAVSETTQADTESVSVPQKGEKKKEKRKLGILELASKEFEDESESEADGAPDLQDPADTVAVQPTSTEPPPPTPDTAADAASTRSNPEHGGPCLQENLQETQASSSECPPKTGSPEPATTAAVAASSKVHCFIFDSESQEEESQSIIGDNHVASDETQPTVNKDAAQSLTQVQLEEDKQRLKELMKQTNKDLVSVTKALLKTNGDFSAALEQLLNPSSSSGQLWKRNDDELLLSAGAVVRQQLQEKYGEEEVAKRIMFLDVEA